MPNLIGATAAVAGKAPLDPKSWSGSSARLFAALSRRGALAAALGVTAPLPARALAGLRSIHPNRATWRRRMAFDPTLRAALTKALEDKLRNREGDLLQIGAYVDGPRARAGAGRAFAYHDGSLAMRLASLYPLRGIAKSAIESALAFEKALARGADLTLTMSAYLRDRIIADYGADPRRVIAVGAGMNIDAPPPPAPDKTYANQELLFVGADFERKGGPELLQAFAGVRKRFPNAILHLAGPRLPASLAPGVIAHGFVDRRALAALYARASLFVLPSRYEPFGIAPIEAMAHGAPALVTGDWALAETVEDAISGAHAPARDPAALETILITLLEESDRLKAMGAAARTRALSLFTWDAVAGRIAAAADACGALAA